ncbi:SPOR domain-containing protein [Streptomyces sp. HNM0574]|uniref:SPOR domain-containing protein n=1 Tax=Streptomyces sp. HNM0574 TaxID=2714954 RepID=UPI00146E1703|nr:SPOR domain-containing protein [Streptomyces sp. HNM0574]NLU66582.1 SPOR domain-containing protein [Streptomyces sp. HNM0574]
MRSVGGGDSNVVLPWHVIRRDVGGGRYRVGSYATRSEAQEIAERLKGTADGSTGDYLVERMDSGSGAQG